MPNKIKRRVKITIRIKSLEKVQEHKKLILLRI